MSNAMDRRKMLKTGLLMAGSMSVVNGLLNQAQARSVNTCYNYQPEWITDKSAILGAPTELKARLFANENPFGPSPKAKAAIADAMAESYQYPFVFARELGKKIADFEGLPDSQIMLSAGSSPLLMAAAIHFSQTPGGNIVTGDPTYEDLPSKAVPFKTTWKKIPLTATYQLDLEAMEKAVDANTSLVYICNPNNPTGTVVDNDKLKAFVDRVSQKVTVFIDEAYIDYLDDPRGTTLISSVKAGRNIIVARTFSKLYGFAGLRVGYVFAQPETIKKLSLYCEGPNSLSALSLHGALASYQDQDFMKEALQKTIASKQFLYSTLKKEGYDYIPSSTNFVLFPLKMDSRQFVMEMGKRGVGVRSWVFNQKQWCRISIGRMDEMEAFASAFKEIS